MRKPYTTIVFDLGNTLIRFDHRIAVRKIAHLSHLHEKDIYALFFDSPLTRAFEKGEISPGEFHTLTNRILGTRIPYRRFTAIWNDIFWEDKAACGIARSLKNSYRLFLLSNVNKLHFSYIKRKFGIMKLFDRLILSYLVGAMKPDRRIFDHMVKEAGGDRGGILYIDDRKDLIKEARKLGIDSIRFEGAGRLKKTLKNLGVI